MKNGLTQEQRNFIFGDSFIQVRVADCVKEKRRDTSQHLRLKNNKKKVF